MGLIVTFYQAALEVLRAAERPLTTAEVTDRALASGLIVTRGKTPHSTMSAVLYKALASTDEISKLEEPGRQRARRGSVRWSAMPT
jgi:HB1, ASXL, restriction endonuclease HTH domain